MARFSPFCRTMARTDSQSLRDRIETTELYGRREELLQALGRGETGSAMSLCREAMNEAAYRARYNCAPIGPEGHKRNFEAIRALRSAIRSAAHPFSGGNLS